MTGGKMTKGSRAIAQRVGPLGTFRTFVSVLREISFDDIREAAELEPRLLIVAPDEATAVTLGTALVGANGIRAITGRALGSAPQTLERFDAIVVFDPHGTGAARNLRGRSTVEGGPAPVFSFDGNGAADAGAIDRLRKTLVERLMERAPAFGRAFVPFRDVAARAVTDESAKANAQFALVSNIPAVVPIVGSLAAAGADFLVLTKNQLLLMFKIAAIHGRDLHDQWGIMRELLPVVGAGLFWRTVAREAASFIPLAAGTIPKVAIAYAGTVSVGRGADLYYRTNERPSRRQIEGFYRQAADAVRRLPIGLPGAGHSSTETTLEGSRAPGANGGMDAQPSTPALTNESPAYPSGEGRASEDQHG